MKKELQRKCIISELHNSTTGKQDQVIKNRVALYELTGVCRRNPEPGKTCSSPKRDVRSHSLVCSENSILIVGIGPILNKELELIFRSDRSDRTCVYS